jgi:hypothetical protein
MPSLNQSLQINIESDLQRILTDSSAECDSLSYINNLERSLSLNSKAWRKLRNEIVLENPYEIPLLAACEELSLKLHRYLNECSGADEKVIQEILCGCFKQTPTSLSGIRLCPNYIWATKTRFYMWVTCL